MLLFEKTSVPDSSFGSVNTKYPLRLLDTTFFTDYCLKFICQFYYVVKFWTATTIKYTQYRLLSSLNEIQICKRFTEKNVSKKQQFFAVPTTKYSDSCPSKRGNTAQEKDALAYSCAPGLLKLVLIQMM